MKSGDRVITPDGPGVIVRAEYPESTAKRFQVHLDVEKYPFDPCYFPNELQKEKI